MKITKLTNGIQIENNDNILTIPFNSTILLVENETDMVLIKARNNNSTIAYDVIDNVTIDGQATTKEDIQASYDKVANSNGGGGETPIEPSQPKWSGHADAEGLRAIGWTDDDIQYYQTYGVNWNEEDDQYHKVPQSNIELYGVINENNVQDYCNILIYLPKIEITKDNLDYLFSSNFDLLTAIPMLDTSKVTSMHNTFGDCPSLTTIPTLDTSNVNNMDYLFYGCYSLQYVPLLNTSNVTSMNSMFFSCYSLTSVPLFDTSKVTSMSSMFLECRSLTEVPLFDTSKVLGANGMFQGCSSLLRIPKYDFSSLTDAMAMVQDCYSLVDFPIDSLNIGDISSFFKNCYSLTNINTTFNNAKMIMHTFEGCRSLRHIGNITTQTSGMVMLDNCFYACRSLESVNVSGAEMQVNIASFVISKESIIYMINNTTKSLTIGLVKSVYDKMNADAEVQAALQAHTSVRLSSLD